jgi:PAS domain S-box-containing protein
MLAESGMRCRIILAASREDFVRSIGKERFDLVLSDNAIPEFSGKEALEIVRTEKPGVPFIFLSGSIGEDAAIKAIRDGATDYILKDRPNRLVPAIQRALREKADAETRRLGEEALRLSEERYALAAMGSNEGLWDWDLKADTLYFSPRWKAMLNYLQDEIGSSPEEWFSRIHPEDVEAVRIQVRSHLKGSIPKLECEYRIRNAQGGYIWALCRGVAIRDADGTPYRMAGSQGDISERKRAEEQLLYDAFHDSLTGLFNRNLFLNRLQRLLWRDRRNVGSPFAVAVFGLDRFGAVNDGLGRRCGDLILKEGAPGGSIPLRRRNPPGEESPGGLPRGLPDRGPGSLPVPQRRYRARNG